jgi:flagellin
MVGINTNIAAQNAQANLTAANSTVSSSVSKLSSGNRIIKASDDVAGLAIGTKLQSNVTALQIGLLNANQAGTVLQIADGALKQVGDILSRQKALAVQANSGSLSNTERGFLNQEFTSLTSEIDRIVDNTNFNGITLLNGSIAGDAGVKVSGPGSATAAIPATLETVAPAVVSTPGTSVLSTSGAVVASGSATTGLTVASTLSISGFTDRGAQGAFIGAITAVDLDVNNLVATAEPNSVQFQATINGRVYQSNRITASTNGGQIDTGTAITFTAQGGGAASSFSITTGVASTAALNDQTNANAFATALTNSVAGVNLVQTKAVTSTVAGTGALAGVASGAASIVSTSGFGITTTTFGSSNGFTVTAGAGAAKQISATINGTTFNVGNFSGGNDLFEAADGPLVLQGRDSLGVLNGQTLSIDLTGLSTPADISTTIGAKALQDALNNFFGSVITPAAAAIPASTSGGYSTVGAIAGTAVTSVSVSSFADAKFQGQGFGTISVAPGSFDENASGAESVTLTTTLGDKTYTAGIVASGNGGNISPQTITFTATDGSGSAFSIGLAASTGGIDTVGSSATFAASLTSSLANVDIFQTRTINTVDVSKITNTVLEGLSASSITVKSNAFDTSKADVSFGNIGTFTGTAGSGVANSLSVKANGVTFSATNLGGIGDKLSSADGSISLIGRDAAGVDNGQRLNISLATLTGEIDLTNQDEVNALTKALNNFVGSSSTGGLSFQVGSTVSDKIDVSVAAVSTSDIYLTDAGVSTQLSIGTSDDAQVAADVLDNAINSIVSRRADVGSLQSRFNFASANLQTSIANQDAARGSFLDADISSESTLFANAQVKLQASVSVLAQANQLPQNLLQLLQ